MTEHEGAADCVARVMRDLKCLRAEVEALSAGELPGRPYRRALIAQSVVALTTALAGLQECLDAFGAPPEE